MPELVIDSFVALYKYGCTIRGEDPDHIKMYEDLDNLTKIVHNSDEATQKLITMGFDPDRICMAVPYDFTDQRKLPDTEDKDGNPLSLETLGASRTISKVIIDNMDNSYIPSYFPTEKHLVSWKLGRLGKYYTMGWEKFVKQYLSGLVQE